MSRERSEALPPGRGRGRQAGFSLIEVMVASVLFLTVSLGIVPMFTQSMVSNSSGNDSTKASNFARARTEEMMHLPFNHIDLTIEAGVLKTLEEYYSADDALWRPYPIPSGLVPTWSRVTTIRQYNVDALDDDLVQISEALPADTDPTFIHLKEIEVGVAQVGALFSGAAKTITVRTLRSH